MNEKKEKWKNWWWYHKTYVIIGVAAAAVVLYSVLPGLLAPKADYTVAMIATDWIPAETRDDIRSRITQAADDRNRDGQILIELYYYQADLSGETEGTLNYTEAARLDADLVGKMSSVFLIDDPEGFHRNTAVPTEPEVLCKDLPIFKEIKLPEGMVFTIRSDSEPASQAEIIYQRILDYR